MRFLTFEELRRHQDFELVDIDLLAEGFKLARPCQMNHIWSTMDDLEKDATQFALDHDYDPETLLVLYDPPRTEKEKEAVAKLIAQRQAEEPDWDDIQIGYVDPKQVVASLYQNMTTEELIKIIFKPSRATT